MPNTSEQPSNVEASNSNASFVSSLVDIWAWFLAMPLWVQVWVAVILFPANLASFFFLDEQFGIIVMLLCFALLCTAWWLPNIFILFYEKGFSNLMALPHILPWAALIVLVCTMTPSLTDSFGIYLWLVTGINAISLAFDIPHAYHLLRRERL